MKHRLQTLLKHKLQWLVLLTALLGVNQGVWGWSIAGSFNSWNKCAYVSVGGYIDFSLAANTSYTFKIWNGNCSSGEDGTWYGNNGTISASTGDSGWQFYTSSGNCTLTTSSAGTYRIKLVSNAPSVQVIFPSSCTTPTASNFTVGTSEYTYDGSSKSVSVTAKYGSPTITVYYTGINGTSYTKSTTAPSAVGRYKVTVNATAVSSYCAVSDLEVATLKIKKTVTVRVKKEGDYASTIPYLYSWYGTDETKGSGNWPGTAMTLDGTSYKYQITFDASTYNIIISKNGSDQTSNITGLSGDVCYSVSSKTATAATATKPTVTTASASSITTTTATLGGNVTDAGQTAACAAQTVTARGIEWVSGTGKTAGAKEAAAAGGTGSFTVAVTGLSAGTTYTYRAYATNAAGTSYGSNVSFTTSSSCSTPSAEDITISAPSSATTLYLGTGSAPSITQTVTATCSKGNTYLWESNHTGYSYSGAWGSSTSTNVAFTSSSSKSTTATFYHEGEYTATFKAGCSNTTDASKAAPKITVKPGHIYFDGPFFSGSGYDLTKQHVEINTSTDQFVYEWTAAYTSGDFVISVGNYCGNIASSSYTIGNYAELSLTGVTKASSGNHNFSPNIGTITVGDRLKLTVEYTGVNSSGVPKYSVTLEKVCAKATAYAVSGTATICSGSNTNITVANSQTGYTYALYKGGVATGATLTGTTGSAKNFSVSAAGTYTVKAYHTSSTYCNNDMSGSATVTVSATSVGGTASATASTVCSGTGTTVSLTGNTGSIQWQKSTTSSSTGFSDISGATSASYSTGNLTQDTWYRAVVTSGACASANSTVATVAIYAAPTITTQPSASQAVCASATPTGISVEASGYELTYQWQKKTTGSWSNASGATATSSSYSIPSTSTANTYYYRCVVTDGCGNSVNSDNHVLTVNPKPTAGTISGSTSACSGLAGGVSLTLSGHTTEGTSIQWQKSTTSTSSGFSNISGANSATLSTSQTVQTYYRANVKYTATTCARNASAVTVSITPDASIGSVTLTSSSVCIGQGLSATANDVVLGGGTGAWSSSNTSVANIAANGNITPVGAGSTNITYTITGGCGGTVSAYATLTVKPNAAAAQYTLSNNTQTYNGAPRSVTVTPATGAGTATVYYSSASYAKSTTGPINAGTYTVTVDAANGTNYCAKSDIELGELTINKANQNTLTISNTLTDFAYCSGASTTLTTSGGSGDGAVTYSITSGAGTVDGSTLTATAKNSITVTATKAASTNYNATTSAGKTFNFTQNPPTAYDLINVGGATSICGDPSSGAGSGTLRLENSQTNYNYQLYSNGSPVEGSSAKAGTTGSSIDFPVTSSGTYTVYGYYGTNSENCATLMNGEITLTISTQPRLVRSAASVTQFMPVTITCISTDIETWSVTDSGSTAYLYDQTYNSIDFKGASTSSSTPKTYTVTATTKGGCSETTTITVNPDTESCN